MTEATLFLPGLSPVGGKTITATFDLMERFGGLSDSKTGDRRAVATALGKLLRRALEALLREEAASRR